jgi:putative endonuclease
MFITRFLYTGVTSDIVKRVQEHKEKKHDRSFSSSYNVDKLVYYKNYLNIEEAILQERRIKGGSRAKKKT